MPDPHEPSAWARHEAVRLIAGMDIDQDDGLMNFEDTKTAIASALDAAVADRDQTIQDFRDADAAMLVQSSGRSPGKLLEEIDQRDQQIAALTVMIAEKDAALREIRSEVETRDTLPGALSDSDLVRELNARLHRASELAISALASPALAERTEATAKVVEAAVAWYYTEGEEEQKVRNAEERLDAAVQDYETLALRESNAEAQP